MTKNALDIPYKCACMAEEAIVKVPVRREDEDVVDWMSHICTAAIAIDHRFRSPDCRAEKIDYIKIPMSENTPYIGAKPVTN